MNSPATVYVYYRVPAEQSAAARRAVMSMFSELKSQKGISGSLARRRDDPLMWMEVYSGVEDARNFERELESLAQRHGLTSVPAPGSSRTLEVFIADVLEPQTGGTACA